MFLPAAAAGPAACLLLCVLPLLLLPLLRPAKIMLALAAALLLPGATAVASSGNVPLDLVMLTDEQSAAKGAVCLDGTNPGFYWTKGSGSGLHTWVLYFKGGGWW